MSELRKPKPHGAVLAWFAGLEDSQLHLSAVTLGEIQAGIELTRQQDGSKAAQLEAWLNQVAAAYNVIAIPFAVAGFVNPLVASLGMAASSAVVMLNVMRLDVRSA